MHPWLSSHLSRLLIDRSGGHRRIVLDLLEDRMRTDFFSRRLIEERQLEQLAALLNHARAHVPAFRDLMKDVPAVDAAHAADALARLPVLRRADLQARPAAYIADNAVGAVDDFTGGSTGTPMIFKVDRPTQQAREASLMWANSLADWRTGERIAMLWGSDRDSKAARNWRLEFRWRLDNMRWYNAFDMGEDRMERFHTGLCRFRPHLIVAYAGSLFTFARFLQAKKRKPPYPLKGLVSSAEVLTAPMRQVVEEVFARPVFDRYGNREAGAIAAECASHRGLHVNEADFLVEVESRDPLRIPGPLIVTYLRNFAMPLIRYDTGDLATLEQGVCSCGRMTRRLGRVVGRQSDTLRTASGKLVHGEFFTHVLYGATNVRNFQFVQDSLTSYRLLLECEGEPEAKQVAAWREKILEAVGPASELAIERVDAIPPLPSGKRKFTLSRVES